MRTAGPGTAADGRSATVPLTNGGRWVVTTDDEGAFDFRELQGGSFNFSVTKSGFVETPFALFPSMSGSALQDKQAVDRRDLKLQRGGVIAGRIVDEFGEPVAGATVNALRVTSHGSGFTAIGRGPDDRDQRPRRLPAIRTAARELLCRGWLSAVASGGRRAARAVP